MKPYIEKMYKHNLSDTHRIHHGVVDVFTEMATKMGKNVKVIYDEEVQQNDIKDVDLVITLGGDHTYLRGSALIWDRRIPLLGINTYSKAFTGALATQAIDYHDRFKET